MRTIARIIAMFWTLALMWALAQPPEEWDPSRAPMPWDLMRSALSYFTWLSCLYILWTWR
jgi:hypothetical protein